MDKQIGHNRWAVAFGEDISLKDSSRLRRAKKVLCPVYVVLWVGVCCTSTFFENSTKPVSQVRKENLEN